MRILVACEFSQIVTKAFRTKGHEAYSCDLLPTEGNPEWHIQDDVLKHLKDGWDMMIAHPPCTYLCNSGVRWLKGNQARFDLLITAAGFFNTLLQADIPKIAIENPIQHKYARSMISKHYDQIVQPHYFGDYETKATCLWLINLPKLKRTHFITEGIKDSIHRCPPSKDRGKIRSRTFQGIADAMAEQWGID